jgi:hypothetical protein
MKKEISPLTQKFIRCVTELKARGIIKKDVELAHTIDYPKTNLSAVLKGKLNIPYKCAFKFATQYQVPNFFSAENNIDQNVTLPEPLFVRPYNLPIILTNSQQDYFKNYEDLRFIETFPRRPILSSVDSRGAEWRWFEAGGAIETEVYHKDDLLLCRMIHTEDWQLQQIGKPYIFLSNKGLFFRRLTDKTDYNFWFSDINKESYLKVSIKSIKELWLMRYSLLSEESSFYQKS